MRYEQGPGSIQLRKILIVRSKEVAGEAGDVQKRRKMKSEVGKGQHCLSDHGKAEVDVRDL